MAIEDKLKELGVEIKPPEPGGLLAPAVKVGNLVFTSGNTSPEQGKVGKDLTVDEAAEAARKSIINVLGNLVTVCPDLNKVKRIVKLLGMVNCAEGFYNTPAVINGATKFLHELFGRDIGWHARSAIGVYQLPGNAAVEIEMIVEVEE
jgi:enamine deaminase RidA (YjgF/YER057c/UK114 family)